MVDSIIIVAFCGANFVYENNCFRQLFYLQIDAFLTDFCSFEIVYEWSSTVRLHLFERIIERATVYEHVLYYLFKSCFQLKIFSI